MSLILALHLVVAASLTLNARPLVGGECCKAKDTFQLCTGDASNTSALDCVNATSQTLGEGEVTVHWAATAFASGAAPTSVRYAYANYPQCALHNKHGLPAGPFVAPLTTAAPEPAQPAAGHEVAAPEPAAPVKTPPMGVNSWCARSSPH